MGTPGGGTGQPGESGTEKENQAKDGPPAPSAGAPGRCEGVSGVRGPVLVKWKAEDRVSGDEGALSSEGELG